MYVSSPLPIYSLFGLRVTRLGSLKPTTELNGISYSYVEAEKLGYSFLFIAFSGYFRSREPSSKRKPRISQDVRNFLDSIIVHEASRHLRFDRTFFSTRRNISEQMALLSFPSAPRPDPESPRGITQQFVIFFRRIQGLDNVSTSTMFSI